MGAASFVGLLLLGGGPLLSVFLVCLARKSFLVLLALGRCVGAGGRPPARSLAVAGGSGASCYAGACTHALPGHILTPAAPSTGWLCSSLYRQYLEVGTQLTEQ